MPAALSTADALRLDVTTAVATPAARSSRNHAIEPGNAVTPSAANPYYNMVEIDPSGEASLSKPPEAIVHGRQKAPTVYDIVAGVYVTSPAYIRQSESIWGGRNATIEIPRERAVDIDTEMDFRLAEFLLQGGSAP